MSELGALITSFGVANTVLIVILYLIVFVSKKKSDRKDKEAQAKIEKEKIEVEAKKEAEREQRENERDIKILEMFTNVMNGIQHGPEHTLEEQEQDRITNEYIIQQLDCLTEEGADRSYFVSMHNGGRDLMGKGLLKMSIVAESVVPEVSMIMPGYQNMPRTMFPILYKNLQEKEYYDIENIEDIKQSDPVTYQFLISHGVKTAMFRSIKRQDGLMLGFIAMEYINRGCEDIKKARRNIDKKTNRIVGALLGTEDENK